ncbi:MAG: hypothetical protein ACMXYM_04945 [Candidatus Woesearchaeota archaeon]
MELSKNPAKTRTRERTSPLTHLHESHHIPLSLDDVALGILKIVQQDRLTSHDETREEAKVIAFEALENLT